MTAELDALKRVAAQRALDFVKDGMLLGLGSGSTSELFALALGERVAAGLKVTAVATSQRVADLARQHGITLIEDDELPRIDLTVDGADEIEPRSFGLIKGRGGALLREKLVATASDRLCIIADDSKLVGALGEKVPVPVAIVPFGWRRTADRIARLGGDPILRRADGAPVVSDDGLYILDCRFGPISEPARVAAALKGLLGVVDHGLFLGLAWRVIVASASGVAVLEPRTVSA
jgi:ribose 5-phosphate isomerase A